MLSIAEIQERNQTQKQRISSFFSSSVQKGKCSLTSETVLEFLEDVLRTCPNLKVHFLFNLIKYGDDLVHLFLACRKILTLSFMVEVLFIVMSSKEADISMKQSCGRLLSSLVLFEEKGLSAVVDFMSAPYNSGDFSLLDRISRVILTEPKEYKGKRVCKDLKWTNI